MKTALTLLFILGITFLSAVDLLTETFSTALPDTWTDSGPGTVNWVWSNTNQAGGSMGELKINTGAAGTYRYISPAVDTRRAYGITLSFYCHANFFFRNTASIVISTDLTNWTEVWSTQGFYGYQSVNINYALGQSETTYIALQFTGDPSLGQLYFDDIVLVYSNSVGIGTWNPGNYDIIGDLVIPNGETLILQAGTTLRFAADKKVSMQGRLLVNGTAEQPVTFTSLSGSQDWAGIDILNVNTANDYTLINYAIIEQSNDSGIYVLNYNKVRISNSTLRLNYEFDGGGGLRVSYSSIVVENCDFYNNLSRNKSSAAYIYQCSGIIFRYNNICGNDNTYIGYGGAFLAESSSLDGIAYNKICNNPSAYGSPIVNLINCAGIFSRNIIANNAASGLYVSYLDGSGGIYNCDIINNGGSGIETYTTTATITNCIIRGNGNYQIVAYTETPVVSYCCIEGGFAGVSGVPSNNYLNNISDNPLFINPTAGTGMGYDALTADWHIQNNFPCINAGNPSSGTDPDASVPDIGVYWVITPYITGAADFPGDQGRQLDLQWAASWADTAYDSNAFYEVWRSEFPRSASALVITHPREITPELAASGRDIYWRDGTRTWYWLNIRIPARLFQTYGAIVPTPQDSSSTGIHAYDYMITFCNSNWFCYSLPVSGYSVDNIPPYAPSRVDIAKGSANQFNLSWDEVTEGGWEGNSYPEINLITYKIYAGNNPDFEISPSTYLLSTTNPYAVLNNQTAERRFYKIIATDSE